MKTLIFNGSPRKNGDTAYLIERLYSRLPGEIKVVNAYRTSVQPCLDCRYCWKNVGCAIDDEMQTIYRDIIEADCIVIASPVYFSELSGALLSMLSRLQTFFSSRQFLGIQQIEKTKTGAVILCGGGNGKPDRAEETARMLLGVMRAKPCFTVRSLHTDILPAREDNAAIGEIDRLAEYLAGE